MKIQLFNKKGEVAYTIPVGDSSTYTWKLQSEEYISVVFSSGIALQVKKGFYTDIDGLGRFEIVTLPEPTASNKADGYEYELRMDRPWAKFKNRMIYLQRGSVLGMESKWSLTDTIESHCRILTDNLTKCGFNYKGDFYHVAIHEGVDTEKSVLIDYDATSLLDALGKIASAFDCEWWIVEDVIHFGRCETGDTEIMLEMHKEIASLSRSEDSDQHGTRLYAFGSSRNLNQNYRRHLKNPFTVNGWKTIYESKVTIKTSKPKTWYSSSGVLEFKSGHYQGQQFPFTVKSGSYSGSVWTDPTFEVEMPVLADIPGVSAGDKVQFVIGDATTTQSDDSLASVTSVSRSSYPCFSFKDLVLPKKAVNSRTTLVLADGTGEKGITYIGLVYSADGKSTLNEGRDFYRFTDGSQPKATAEQQATLAHASMMYVNKLYTEPVDGQAEVTVQSYSENVLQLPIGTPYIDSPGLDDDDEIVEVREQNEDIYPRALLTIDSLSTIDAKETDEETGSVSYWKAYRFTAKKQDGTPFYFDDSYLINEDDKPLSIHFESGNLSGLEFEVHFNPDDKPGETRVFEITRNSNYKLELPNDAACPQVGDTLYMFNMDADIIDDELVTVAEQELKAWAEKEMVKICRDSGTYTATVNPVELGRKKLGMLLYGQKVKLKAPHLVHTEDGTRSSRIIAWELRLQDTTQGEYTIGESSAYSTSQQLSNDVQELIYYNGQIRDSQTGGGSSRIYDKLIGKLQTKTDSLEKKLETKLSKVQDDSTPHKLTMGEAEVKGALAVGGEADVNGSAAIGGDLTVGTQANGYGITKEGIAKLAKMVVDEIKSSGFHAGTAQGFDGTGFGLTKDENSRYTMELDNLIVRMKMIIAELEVHEMSYIGGSVVLSPCGNRIDLVKGFNKAGEDVTKEGVTDKTVSYYRCYFLANDGTREVKNEWVVGQFGRCKTNNITKAGTYTDYPNQDYWRLCVGVSSAPVKIDSNDNKEYHYIELSNETGTVSLIVNGATYNVEIGGVRHTTDKDTGVVTTSDSTPSAGDKVIGLGHAWDASRQNAAMISADDNIGWTLYKGINDYDLKSDYIVNKFSIDETIVTTDHYTLRPYAQPSDTTTVTVMRGEYDPTKIYGHNDLVTYNGQVWICTIKLGDDPITGKAPTLLPDKDNGNKVYWAVYTAKGADGTTYDVYLSTSVLKGDSTGKLNDADSLIVTAKVVKIADGKTTNVTDPNEAYFKIWRTLKNGDHVNYPDGKYTDTSANPTSPLKVSGEGVKDWYFVLYVNGVETKTVTLPVVKDGEQGNSFEGIEEKYFATADEGLTPTVDGNTWAGSIGEAGWSASVPYLWAYTITKMSDGATTNGTPYLKAVWGQKGDDGYFTSYWYGIGGYREGLEHAGLARFVFGDDGVTPGDNSKCWSQTMPSVSTGNYLWQASFLATIDKGVLKKASKDAKVSYVCLSGENGTNGATGYSYAFSVAKKELRVLLPEGTGEISSGGFTLKWNVEMSLFKITGTGGVTLQKAVITATWIKASGSTETFDSSPTSRNKISLSGSISPYNISADDRILRLKVEATLSKKVVAQQFIDVAVDAGSWLSKTNEAISMGVTNGKNISDISAKADHIALKVHGLGGRSVNILSGGNVAGMFSKRYEVWRSSAFTIEQGKTYTVTARIWMEPSSSGHFMRLFVFGADNSWSTQYPSDTYTNTLAMVVRFKFEAGVTKEMVVGLYEQGVSTGEAFDGVHIDWCRVDEGDWTGDEVLDKWEPAASEVDTVNLLPDPAFEHDIAYSDYMGERNSYNGAVGADVADMTKDKTKDEDGCYGVTFDRSGTADEHYEGLVYYVPYRGAGTYFLSFCVKDLSRTVSGKAAMDEVVWMQCFTANANKERSRNGFACGTQNTSDADSGAYRVTQVYTFDDDTDIVDHADGTHSTDKIAFLEVRLFLLKNGCVRVSRLCLSKSDHYTYWNAAAVSAERKKELGQLATGIDIFNKRLVLTADKTVFQTNSGKEVAVFDDTGINAKALETVSDDPDDASRTVIEGSTTTWYRKDGKPGIRIFYDGDGAPHLQFYGKTGTDSFGLTYDLGPTGIKKLLDSKRDAYSEAVTLHGSSYNSQSNPPTYVLAGDMACYRFHKTEYPVSEAATQDDDAKYDGMLMYYNMSKITGAKETADGISCNVYENNGKVWISAGGNSGPLFISDGWYGLEEAWSQTGGGSTVWHQTIGYFSGGVLKQTVFL